MYAQSSTSARFARIPTGEFVAAVRGDFMPGQTLRITTRAGKSRDVVLGEVLDVRDGESLVRIMGDQLVEGAVGVRVMSLSPRHRINVGATGAFDLPGGGGPDGTLWRVIRSQTRRNDFGHWVFHIDLVPGEALSTTPVESGRPKLAKTMHTPVLGW